MHFCVISIADFIEKLHVCEEWRRIKLQNEKNWEFKFQIKVKHLIYYTFFSLPLCFLRELQRSLELWGKKLNSL